MTEINEIMLFVADEIARQNCYILTDEKTIIGKNDWFWGNKAAYPEAQVKSCTYILPVWEDEQKAPGYYHRKIHIDMFWGNPRIHVTYPDKTSCCLTYDTNACTEAQAFGNDGLKRALTLKNRIDELLKKSEPMIKATTIFGETAVERYQETGKIPSTRWLNKNGGVVDEVEFKTKTEYDAYVRALNDVNGWYDSDITPAQEIQEDCPFCKQWRAFFSDKQTITYCPDCGQKILN